jgi:hypothetical protein
MRGFSIHFTDCLWQWGKSSVWFEHGGKCRLGKKHHCALFLTAAVGGCDDDACAGYGNLDTEPECELWSDEDVEEAVFGRAVQRLTRARCAGFRIDRAAVQTSLRYWPAFSGPAQLVIQIASLA